MSLRSSYGERANVRNETLYLIRDRDGYSWVHWRGFSRVPSYRAIDRLEEHLAGASLQRRRPGFVRLDPGPRFLVDSLSGSPCVVLGVFLLDLLHGRVDRHLAAADRFNEFGSLTFDAAGAFDGRFADLQQLRGLRLSNRGFVDRRMLICPKRQPCHLIGNHRSLAGREVAAMQVLAHHIGDRVLALEGLEHRIYPPRRGTP